MTFTTNRTPRKPEDRGYTFTSESVSEGHPDKLADQVSDAILDRFLAGDPTAKVAAECMIGKDFLVVTGEIGTSVKGLYEEILASVPDIARGVLREAGYDSSFPGIDPDTCEIQVRLNTQSADINQGVDRADGILGAGDQGLMFGYACNETPELMPLPISLAHALVRRQSKLRREGTVPWLKPDAKSQVSVRYCSNKPQAIEAVVLSTQHDAEVDLEHLRGVARESIIEEVIPEHLRYPSMKMLINPTGRFVIGGPEGDAGLTGRKIIVDTYGGFCPHGGGAFSGKDPSKVDRSGAYAARYVAKNIVAAGLAKRCTVQISYTIGVSTPTSLLIDCHGDEYVPSHDLEKAVKKVFDLTPAGIIKALDLRKPIYSKTAVYGHFGNPAFSWEQTDKVNAIRKTLDLPEIREGAKITRPGRIPIVEASLNDPIYTRGFYIGGKN